MTRALTRTPLHSSTLTRVLTDLAVLEAAEPGVAFAQKLGLWLDFNDAITLCAAHNASAPAMPCGETSGATAALGDELARTRAVLVNSITKSALPSTGRTRITLPSPKPDMSMEEATAYEPYRRYYAAHQRDMETSVRPLRAQVREVLAKASPALRQLAALDAVLDGILGVREGKLLGTVPLLLEQRFAQLLKTHQQTLGAAQQEDTPARWMKTGGWLARFCHEMQTVLLAELDVRLQPTVGLIEAFNNQIKQAK